MVDLIARISLTTAMTSELPMTPTMMIIQIITNLIVRFDWFDWFDWFCSVQFCRLQFVEELLLNSEDIFGGVVVEFDFSVPWMAMNSVRTNCVAESKEHAETVNINSFSKDLAEMNE